MSALAEETRQIRNLIDRVERLEGVASRTVSAADRAELLEISRQTLADAAPVRPRIASELLALSEKTVRAWTEEGVLLRAETSSPRLLLDLRRLHDVMHLVRELRADGRTTGLLDEVYRRLVDETWAQRSDLDESLSEMRRGEGTLRVPRSPA